MAITISLLFLVTVLIFGAFWLFYRLLYGTIAKITCQLQKLKK
jgi:flagellar biogenesis protein FliO